MYESEKRQIIEAALEIKAAGLIHLTGGNVSVRTENGDVILTPSGMPYETMTPDQLIVLAKNGEKLEGNLRPSVDTVALLYIFDKLPEVNAIIHTHQPYASAVGLIADELPACTTTLCNACGGAVNVAPYSSAASLDMGVKAVENLRGKLAVILKHHGVVTVGANLNEALFSAIYLEDSAKCYLAALSASRDGKVALLTEDEARSAVEVFKDYGQKQASR
jgi:L-ribulose-5-phosphate 4-epimerase